VVRINWDALPTSRDPLEPDEDSLYGYKWGGMYGSLYDEVRGGATSVNSSFVGLSDALYFSGEDEAEKDYFQELIFDALSGHPKYLIEFIAESVYPEDPTLAARLIDKKLITDELLEEARAMLSMCDVDYIACWLYDNACITV
jgi:hypothetical protein